MDLELRLALLEKRVRLLQASFVVAAIVAVAGTVCLALHPSLLASPSGGVLRAKGLVIQDGMGHDRILIGAPVPAASGRKRHDDTVGIIILGKDGADRIALGAPAPEPQMNGAVGQRIGQSTGLILDDDHGDERGGFAVLNNDNRIVLGLDYPHGSAQAINIGVLPDEASISLNDSTSLTRASLTERHNAAPLLFGLGVTGHSTGDISIVRLNHPYRVQQLQIPLSDQALNKALDDASR